MVQDDPEQRIADLERQLAEQKRGVAPLPAESDHARPGSASNSDPAQRRFAARIIPNARQNLITWGLLSAGGVVLLVGGATLTLAAPTNPALIPIVMLVGLVALVALALLALRRLWANKVVICITAEGLTIDQRPGDVFPFRDAELGQWRGLRQRGPELAGRALCLTCGPHRFVLGAADRRVASQLPLEGPQVGWGHLDALMSPQHFDELLAILWAA